MASKRFTKANIENVPVDEYIAEHKGEFKGGSKFQYKLAPSKEAAERIERKEIKNWKPVFNDKHK